MSNTKIQLKKSGVSGNVPVDLHYGEPALNYDDGRLYYKAADGSIGYISSTHSFNTINVDSTLLFATSNSDILSIVPAFGISLTGSGKTITIGDGATSNIAQGAFNHSNTRFSANGGIIYGSVDILGYANVQNTIVVGTGAYTILPNLVAQFTGNTELYSQVNQQNINANGTADFVVTADNGTDEINYLDMGIAGSTYVNSNYNSWHFVNPNDAYLILQGNASQNFGGNVFFGTSGSGSGGDQIGDIAFVQGSDTDNEVARFVLHEGLVIKTKTASTSNSSGALVVQGGIGANGSIYGDAVYDSNIRILDRANAANSKAQAAYDYANTIGAGTVDQTARDTANGAFGTANGAFSEANLAYGIAQSAYDYANTISAGSIDQTARSTANGAFDKANTDANNIVIVGSYANSAYTQANTGNTTAQASFDKSNTNSTNITIAASYANSAYTTANLAQSYSNSAYTKSNTNATDITIVASYANSSYIAANLAESYANSAYTAANLAQSYSNSAFTKSNTNATDITIVASYANSAYTKSNTNADNITIVGSYANSAYTAANLAQSYSNSAFTKANTNATDITITASYANSAYTKANTGNTTAQAAFDKANTDATDITIVASYANSSYTAANLAQSYANGAFSKSNTNATDITIVGSYANSAYADANSKTKTYVQDTAPTGANVDDIWIDSSTGIEYTYISSNSASQWIEFGPYSSPLNGTANIQFADQTIFGTKPNQDIVILSSGTANIKLNAANTVITGNFLPTTTNTQSLGSSTLRWGDVWVGPNTLNMTDIVTGNNSALTVANGILLIQGANQLQVGQLKFVDNKIQSTTGNINIEIGETISTANLVLNRNVVTAAGKTIITTGNVSVGNLIVTGTSNLSSNTKVKITGGANGQALITDGSGNLSWTTLINNITPTYGQFWSNTSQTVAVKDTEYSFTFNNSDGSNNVQLGTGAANSRIIINKTGLYNIQFSTQIDKTGGGETTAYIWLKKNGTVIPDSAGFFTIDAKIQVVQSWNLLANVTSVGDYYEIAYAASDTNFSFPALAANPTIGYPSSPSIIITVTPIGA